MFIEIDRSFSLRPSMERLLLCPPQHFFSRKVPSLLQGPEIIHQCITRKFPQRNLEIQLVGREQTEVCRRVGIVDLRLSVHRSGWFTSSWCCRHALNFLSRAAYPPLEVSMCLEGGGETEIVLQHYFVYYYPERTP